MRRTVAWSAPDVSVFAARVALRSSLVRGTKNRDAAVIHVVAEAFARFRHDVARWVIPQEVAPLDHLSFITVCKLVYRHPPLRAMAWFRLGTVMQRLGVPGVPGWTQRRILRLYGLELLPSADIGGGLYIAHPVGCVLVAERIGRDVTVIGQATFGTRTDNRWPVIGDRAFVGVGARVLGGITVGEDAHIGANAVVVRDVPAGSTVVGIPAREVRSASNLRAGEQ